MALLCTFPLFDSKLLPMAYSLTFNLLALLCTPPLGGKTSCCLLPVFCLLFRFVLQGLIIKTKFFGHLSVLWKMSEWNELSFLIHELRRGLRIPPPQPGSGTDNTFSSSHLTLTCCWWLASPLSKTKWLLFIFCVAQWDKHVEPVHRPQLSLRRVLGTGPWVVVEGKRAIHGTSVLAGVRMVYWLGLCISSFGPRCVF